MRRAARSTRHKLRWPTLPPIDQGSSRAQDTYGYQLWSCAAPCEFKTYYNIKYTCGNEMWPAIGTAWWFKCELQRDDNQGQQAPRFDISRGLYKENHQQLCILKNLRAAQCEQSRSCLAGVDLSLRAYGSQPQQCCRACCRHVVQWLHTFYSQLFLKTWMLHHDICKPWQQICLYPWHEMTSGERIVVKSGKSMSIAVSMRISVELRAAMARERILKQGRPGKKIDAARLRTVAQRLANTPSTPKPPEWHGNTSYAFGKNLR